MSSAPDSATQAAAAKAFHQATIELWTLYSIALASTFLRTYARVRAVGWSNLRMDELFVWIGVLFHAAQTSLGYEIGPTAHGLANNGMTDAQRAALSRTSEEYHQRVMGSKIQVAGWTTYSCLIWSYKLSMLFFYVRLTEGLGRRFRTRIYVGFLLVLASFLAAILSIFAGCRPFHKYWQINPNPGRSCQAGISLPIVWSSFAANVSTDIYLIMIPLPMLWRSSLQVSKKVASTIVLGAGIFVLVCATLKSVFVLVDPDKGGALAAAWGIREAFVACITTNLPMIFPLLKAWFRPFYETMCSHRSSQSDNKTPTGFRTIGGGRPVGNSGRSGRKKPPTANPITTNITFTASEERIVEDLKMQNLKTINSSTNSENQDTPSQILVSKQVEVVHEDRHSSTSENTAPVGEHW